MNGQGIWRTSCSEGGGGYDLCGPEVELKVPAGPVPVHQWMALEGTRLKCLTTSVMVCLRYRQREAVRKAPSPPPSSSLPLPLWWSTVIKSSTLSPMGRPLWDWSQGTLVGKLTGPITTT